MQSISNRQRRLAAQKAFKKESTTFMLVENRINAPDWLTRAFSNNQYKIMINDHCPTTHGEAIRVFVQKLDDTPIRNHWSEMMRIKNELFGRETVAIEYYPAQSELVNVHNIYWMFIFPDGVISKILNPQQL
jgi:hypothetical protein